MANYKHKGSVHVFGKEPEGPGVLGWILIGFIALGLLGQCAG